MTLRLALATSVAALILGAIGGFALGAARSDGRADNCQDAAQQMYDALNRADPNTAIALTFTDDYCPIDEVQN
jgi:hypothetical protein